MALSSRPLTGSSHWLTMLAASVAPRPSSAAAARSVGQSATTFAALSTGMP
jgi:hypothetical protein